MRRLLTITTMIAATALLCSPAPALADGACERGAETFKLKIKVRDNKPVEVTHRGSNAETLAVCPGDQIEWKLINPASAPSFFVNFASSAPFRGESRRNASNGKILVTISDGLSAGASFKYDIGIDGGGVWDPVIIIDE